MRLVPADLLHSQHVTLEQPGHAGPVIQQPPDPGQADQPDADLDAARPVHAGQEGVLPEPGAKLVGYPAGITLVVGQEPGRGQQREVLQAGDFPDLLDVAGLLLGTMIDPEGALVLGGPAAGNRIVEPVGPDKIGPGNAQYLPLTLQQLVCGGKQVRLGRPGY